MCTDVHYSDVSVQYRRNLYKNRAFWRSVGKNPRLHVTFGRGGTSLISARLILGTCVPACSRPQPSPPVNASFSLQCT